MSLNHKQNIIKFLYSLSRHERNTGNQIEPLRLLNFKRVTTITLTLTLTITLTLTLTLTLTSILDPNLNSNFPP